ncbi:MAG: hypothetical protein U9O59_01555 [Actinomycetota bacterium]|nr:hypothetical protein [Actinomycetota bacterium]
MDEIKNILSREGPLTGKELCDSTKMDELSLWRACNKDNEITLRIFGERFLRLDNRVKGYARLSPSIKREFLTYTVAGLNGDLKEITAKTVSIHEKIRNISRQKLNLAGEIIKKIAGRQESPGIITERTCFIIAGDIVYMMSHSEPRPEASTGKIINGSDLDIIIVTEKLPFKIKKNLDDSIYREKYYLIKNPSYREEIDYIIKDISKVKIQLKFNTFKSRVALKILNEGKFLYGSREIYTRIKNLLSERNIPERLTELKEEAVRNRDTVKCCG